MNVISINVAQPLEVTYAGKKLRTGIFKQPVQGPVAVEALQMAGDGQADLVKHGGADKAVYAYAFDHYAWWRHALGRSDLSPGMFGENLTVAGLDETTLCLGDELRVGSVRFCITQPRTPCFKLGLRLGDQDMPRRFAQSLRTGFYLRVLEPGLINTGDELEVTLAHPAALSIRDLFDAYLQPGDGDAQQLLRQALQVNQLSAAWRSDIEKRLARN